MKLAVLIEYYHPHGGGAERSTSQIVRELARRGHEVTILAGYSPSETETDGVTIERFSAQGPKSWLWVAGFSRWARQRLLTGQFDSSLSVTSIIPAALIQPRSGTVQETQHRNIAMRSHPMKRLCKKLLLGLSVKQQLLRALERRALSDPIVQWFVPGSRYVAQQLQTHHGIDASRIRVITNAAEMPRVNDEQRHKWREEIRTGFNISNESTVFLFAAYNPRLKGIEPLLHAARRLADQGIDFTLLLAGRIGYAQQHMAADLRIRDRVRIVATTDQMVQLYAAADVTVHPTFYDPASKVVIESLMMGTPAISTAFNGASDLILDGDAQRGRVIADPTDIAALTKAMVDLTDPVQRQACKYAMRGEADRLSVQKHVDSLEQLLSEMHVTENKQLNSASQT